MCGTPEVILHVDRPLDWRSQPRISERHNVAVVYRTTGKNGLQLATLQHPLACIHHVATMACPAITACQQGPPGEGGGRMSMCCACDQTQHA